MAEGIFQDLIVRRELNEKLTCDSAGTADYHAGKLPDHRMRETAQKHQINLTHRARQLSRNDLENFDYILAMDKANLADILFLRSSYKKIPRAKVMLIRDFDLIPSTGNVPDPYYGGLDGFEEVYQILKRCNEAFITFLEKEHFNQEWL
jgi:protein-tyrosine phosphatase